MAKEEFFYKQNILKRLAGINENDFANIVKFYPEVTPGEDGIPLMKLLNTLNKAFQQSIKVTTKAGGEEDVKITQAMLHEKLQKERIHNQQRLGLLMRKSEAYERTLKLCALLTNTVKHNILMSAAQLYERGWCESKRDAEILLNQTWNESINFVKDNASIIDWQEDGKYKVLQTRLTAVDDLEVDMGRTLDEMIEFSESTDLGEEDFDVETI